MKIEQFSKKEIAVRQIETALDLFFSGSDLFSVITLAGAGEEILGKYVEAQGEKPAVAKAAEAFKVIFHELFKEPREINEVKWSVLNNARNEIKHMKVKEGKLDPQDEIVNLDPHDSAVHMLTRAIENYYGLTGLLSENMQRFLKEEYSKPPWPSSRHHGIERS